jgi:hypothetical protein
MKILKSLRRYPVRVSEIQNRREGFRVYRHEFRSRENGRSDYLTSIASEYCW